MTSKRIGVFEYCFGGGLGEQAQNCKELLTEGRQMAIGIAADLESTSNFRVSLAVDKRWESDSPNPMHTFPVDPAKPLIPQWINLGKDCDSCLVIAPEIDEIFLDIVESFRSEGIDVVASNREFISATADKWATYQSWNAAGIPTPLTIPLDELHSSSEKLQSLTMECVDSLGFVVKRKDGAGCYGLTRFPTLESLLHKTSNWSDRPRYIAQPWVRGQPASLCFIETDGQRNLMPPCLQRIESMRDGNCVYAGGKLLDDHDLKDQLEKQMDRWIGALPGANRGWIGVDFLIDHSNPKRFIPIEVNPRLTSSFIGLRKLFGPALAASLFTKTDEELTVRSASTMEWTMETGMES